MLLLCRQKQSKTWAAALALALSQSACLRRSYSSAYPVLDSRMIIDLLSTQPGVGACLSPHQRSQ